MVPKNNLKIEKLGKFVKFFEEITTRLKIITNEQFEKGYLVYVKKNHSKSYFRSNGISFKQYLAFLFVNIEIASINLRKSENQNYSYNSLWRTHYEFY